MASTITVALFLLAVVVMAEASIYRTTIFIEDNSRESSERCRRELSERQLGSCRSYVQYGSSERGLDDFNPNVPERCCNQLRNIREDCRCEALNMLTQEMQQHGGQERMQRRMLSRAENLPSLCGIGPSHCDIRRSY